MTYLTIFFVQLARVAVRAFQQMNVSGRHYLRVIPTAFAFAACEIFFIGIVVSILDEKGAVILVAGVAGVLGCWASMWLSDYLNGRGE